MRLLVLGGTGFVGRAVIEAATARGAVVTALNRGSRRPPPGVDLVPADRGVPGWTDTLKRGDRYDAVVDTWSGPPYVVRDAVRALVDRLTPGGRYVYVSSRSVYRYPPAPGLAEDGPLVEGSPDAGENGEAIDYAATKRGAEIAVETLAGERGLLVRAGLILGPHEDVGRLPWWLSRVARGGVVPAPGPIDADLQYIDARDLANWMVDGARSGLGGAFNLVGPPGSTTMGELLDTCVRVSGSDAELRWIPPEKVLAAGVQPWTDLPIWLPPGPEHDGMHRGDVRRALATGLRCRPVAETVADTWAWLRSLDGPPPQRADRLPPGLSPEQEHLLLGAA